MLDQKKEKLPIDTVNEIRCKLSEYGINPVELWQTANGNLFAVRLRTPYHRKLSEGKGVSCEYALASAYGELMERLQNFAINGFKFFDYSDKKIQSQEKFLSENQNFFNDFFSDSFLNFKFNTISNTDKLKELQKIITHNADSDIELIPFYSIKQKKLINLPYQILRKIHSSNGMCSGNTIAEALVQGLSEIAERYCTVNIFRKNITPPIIPQEYYCKYEYINNVVNFYKRNGYETEIRDFSLSMGFPVVCMILKNIQNNKYTVSVGSHPIMHIAIERCFTELRQERDPLLNPEFLKEIKKSSDIDIDNQEEIKEFFRIGEISLSDKFFNSNPDWQYNHNFWGGENDSNEKLLKNLINTCLTVSKDIFIRDVSFLGFNSFHILAPGMSEVFFDMDYLNTSLKSSSFNENLTNIIYSVEPDMEIIQSLYNFYTELFEADNPFSQSDILLLISLAFILNKKDKIISYLNKWIAFDDNNKTAHLLLKYFSETKDSYSPEEENIISVFQSKNVIRELYVKKLIEYMPIMSKIPDDIINNLKRAYKKQPPSQNNLVKYLKKI